MPLDIPTIRTKFPALEKPYIFFDNPAGTQIAQQSLDRISDYLVNSNSNKGGQFPIGAASDEVIHQAHAAAADFLGASRPEEVVFGPNMTTLTFSLSRSLALWLEPGDAVVVTNLDHDADVSPWVRIAQDRGCRVIQVDFHPEDGTLNMKEMEVAIAQKPKIVAVGYASNSLGTINPVEKIVEMAHAVGALVFIDAVQYAPHGPIDVEKLDCDFLVCSAYKFFGPHVGLLYGKYDLLDRLNAYQVRPAPKTPPVKFETGTQNHEGIAGVLGAIEYLEWLGTTYGGHYAERYGEDYAGRALHLRQAMAAIQAYEYEYMAKMLDMLETIPGLTLYGPADPRRVEGRVPTFSVRLEGWHPTEAAAALGKAGINVWHGNYYALAVTERLGFEESGGMVRIGAVHYNTLAEIDKLEAVLGEMAASKQ